MSVPDGDHGGQDVIPCFRLHHHGIGEHAAIPADMTKCFREPAIRAVQPVTGMMRNIQFPVRIVRQAMVPGFVMRSGAFHGGIILRHVEVNRPRAERLRQSLHRIIQAARVRPVPAQRQNGIFGSIVAENIKESVGHIGLESQCPWPVHSLQQVQHFLPTVHSAPANFTFGCQPFTHAFGDVARLSKRLNDLPLIGFRVLRPVAHATSRINTHDSVGTRPQFAQPFTDPASFADLFDKLFSLVATAHGRTASGGRPYRRDE